MAMKTLTTSDALDKLARQIKSLDARADVYFLPSDNPTTVRATRTTCTLP